MSRFNAKELATRIIESVASDGVANGCAGFLSSVGTMGLGAACATLSAASVAPALALLAVFGGVAGLRHGAETREREKLNQTLDQLAGILRTVGADAHRAERDLAALIEGSDFVYARLDERGTADLRESLRGDIGALLTEAKSQNPQFDEAWADDLAKLGFDTNDRVRSLTDLVMERFDSITDSLTRIEETGERTEKKLDALLEMLANKQAGEDPTVRPILTPKQQMAVDAALSQGDSEDQARAAIIRRDFENADQYLADALPPVLDKAFELLTLQGDRWYFAGEFDNAIEPYRKAKALRPDDPRALFNLGAALSLAKHDSTEANKREAIACYEAALEVYTRSDHPVQWAAVHNNLGNTWCDLPSDDSGENLIRGIACYESAMEVYTRSAHPVGWAATQNNLGIARGMLADEEGQERCTLLSSAIAAVKGSLTIFTSDAFPYDNAKVSRNLHRATSMFICSGCGSAADADAIPPAE